VVEIVGVYVLGVLNGLLVLGADGSLEEWRLVFWVIVHHCLCPFLELVDPSIGVRV
jgi:hypothetical protein